MENTENIRAYALYTFLDEASAKRINRPPFSAFHTYFAYNALLRRTLKEYFSVEPPEGNLLSYKGKLGDVFFSFASCRRLLSIAVSDRPIGVSVQVPFDIYHKKEFLKEWLHENEYKALENRFKASGEDFEKWLSVDFDDQKMNSPFDDYFFEFLSKKVAMTKKYRDKELGYYKMIDSTTEPLYTFKRFEYEPEGFYFADKVYYLTVTGKAELIEVPIEEVL